MGLERRWERISVGYRVASRRPAALYQLAFSSRTSQFARLQLSLNPANDPPRSSSGPSPPTSPGGTPMYSQASAASSAASFTLPRPFNPSELHSPFPPFPLESISTGDSSIPLGPSTPSRGRSSSRESTRRPSSGGDGKTTIRFAPLPEIRQRAYSTGHNVWLEDADVSDGVRSGEEAGEAHRGFAIRDQEDNYGDDSAVADSDDEEGSLSRSIFGSWKSDLSLVRSRGDESGGSSAGGEAKSDASSYTSKLLRPLSFGLVKKKKSKSKVDGRSESLSRISSNDSDVSRRSMNDGGPRPSSGVPMRKTRTWEPGETQTQSRRANYPPVAQRSKTRTPIARQAVSVPEPSFVEWGSAGTLGSVGKPPAEDEDDGSGMAWIRRRRAEREAEKKRKEEEEAVAEKKRLEEEEEAEEEEEEAVRSNPDDVDEMDLDLGEDDEPLPCVPPEVTVSEPPTTSSGATTPKASQSLLSTSRPNLHLITSITPITPATPSITSIASPTVIAPTPTTFRAPPLARSATLTRASSSNSTSTIDDKPISSPSQSIPASNRLSVGSFGHGDGTDGEESDDPGVENDEDDDDSDLDDDELAEEEALAEQARVTAKGAGASFSSFPFRSCELVADGFLGFCRSRTIPRCRWAYAHAQGRGDD